QLKARTPKEIIEKLMTDSDPSVRLRAVEMWQKHFEESRTSSTGYADLVRVLTDDEKAALREALDWIAAIKEAVYARHPDLEPDARTVERRRLREQDERQQEAEREAAVARTDALVKSDNEQLNESLEPSADLPTPENSPVIELPFEPLDGQLSVDDVRRLYD